MKKQIIITSVLTLALSSFIVSADLIAGTDFSDAMDFNEAGGNLDNILVDDLDLADNISVSAWNFANAGAFRPFDGNAQVGMTFDLDTNSTHHGDSL